MKQTVPLAAPPAEALPTFGAALPAVTAFGERLASVAVERGLLGPHEVERLWERHLLNSAALAPFMPGSGLIVDLGSGAGLPGVVLALMRPDLQWVLLEPLLRRYNFLMETVELLHLSTVKVVRARAEDWVSEAGDYAEVVVARAVAPLERLAGWAMPLVAPGGCLLALKGESAEQELAAATPTLSQLGVRHHMLHKVALGTSVTTVVQLEKDLGTRAVQSGLTGRTG